MVLAIERLRDDAISSSLDGIGYSTETSVIDTFLLDDKHADDRQSLYHAILHREPAGLEALRTLLGVENEPLGERKPVRNWPRWKIGDRVTRKKYMDDGTWNKLGDSCLDESPLKHGTIIKSDAGISRDAVVVRFDDGSEGTYLDHGLQSEAELGPQRATPASVARIEAERKQVANQLDCGCTVTPGYRCPVHGQP